MFFWTFPYSLQDDHTLYNMMFRGRHAKCAKFGSPSEVRAPCLCLAEPVVDLMCFFYVFLCCSAHVVVSQSWQVLDPRWPKRLQLVTDHFLGQARNYSMT